MSEKEEINILEPSVGVGNFIPFILKKYEDCKMINLDVVDIDKNNIRILKLLLKKYKMPNNVKINYIADDTLKYGFDKKYDLVIASQVLEHLGIRGQQVKVFDEIERISHKAIITP